MQLARLLIDFVTVPPRRRSLTRRPRAHVGALSAMLAFALVAALPGVASATHTWRVFAELNSECLYGRAARNATVKVVLKSADGSVRARFGTSSDSYGYWDGCFSGGFQVQSGNRIVVRSAGLERISRVPRLSIRGDRETGLVSGRAPADSTVVVYWCTGGITWCDEFSEDVTVDSGGFFERIYALRGADALSVELHRPSGDVFRTAAWAAFMRIRIGSDLVAGIATPPPSAITVDLWRNSSPIATGSAVVAIGSTVFRLRLTDPEGRPVYPLAGDRVRGSFARDADWVIPTTWVRGDASEDRAWGRCFGNAEFEVTRTRIIGLFEVESSLYGGYPTESDGWFDTDIPGLRRTDGIRVDCQAPTGDIVGRTGRVTR